MDGESVALRRMTFHEAIGETGKLPGVAFTGKESDVDAASVTTRAPSIMVSCFDALVCIAPRFDLAFPNVVVTGHPLA